MPGRTKKEKEPRTAPAAGMELVFIVYSNAVDDEIVEIIKRLTGGYTKFAGVLGEGNGEPHLGTHIWPEINNCIMVAAPGTTREILAEEVSSLKKKFPGVGISIFVAPLSRMY